MCEGSTAPTPARGQPRPEGGDRAESRSLHLLPPRCRPGCRWRMCLATRPRPWIPLPLRSRCSRSFLQAPRRLRGPWPGRAGCSGRCSGVAAATAAAAGARAPPACPSTRPPARSPRASRAAAACCCCSGPPRPPPLRHGASRLGLRPPEAWRGLPARPPPPPPRLPPLTQPCAPLCCRSRWRRPRAGHGVTARYAGSARGRARDPPPAARTWLRARFACAPEDPRHTPHPHSLPPSPPIGPRNKGRSLRPRFFSLFCSLECLVDWTV